LVIEIFESTRDPDKRAVGQNQQSDNQEVESIAEFGPPELFLSLLVLPYHLALQHE
jgi:hypothetical protein